tara:strand:+ start:51156 stop:54833 length:3678 start_codon:yes stop_codon:yes gene_type:complete
MSEEEKISLRPLLFQKPGPNIYSETQNDRSSLKDLVFTNFDSTASFRYDSPGQGLKSTQQVPIDWSKFENHTFFESAQSKVNVAFDKIINEFPFDGTQRQTEAFMDSLTGFEKHVFDRFPKSVGYLRFSGYKKPPGKPEQGTYISVKDSAGFLFPDFSSRQDGEAVIDFYTKPFSFEYHILVESQANDNQIVFQKQSADNLSVTVALSASNSTEECDMIFNVYSGSQNIFVSASISKGSFVHVVNEYDRNNVSNVKIFFNQAEIASSSAGNEFKDLGMNRADFIIGSGSTVKVKGGIRGDLVKTGDFPTSVTSFIPKETFSGSLDEVRIFHETRSIEKQKDKGYKSIYPENGDLRIYFKFNEPTGSYEPRNVVLDSSGNSLHSIISNFDNSVSDDLRLTGSILSPIVSENLAINPILFPDNHKVITLNVDLLTSASSYDDINPNLITRLFPPHLFSDGQANQGLSSLQGGLFDQIAGQSIPGSAKLGSSQYFTAFLMIYAKFFDDIKVFLDHISNILHVDYEDDEIVASQFLPLVARYYGIEMPTLFSPSNILEFIDGENIGAEHSFAAKSLRDVQNELWKRFLINLPFFMRSKGTVNGIKSVIRSFGINPDRLMNIREFGGPTRKSLSSRRYSTIKKLPYLTFSGSNGPHTVTDPGFSEMSPYLITSHLSGARRAPKHSFPKASDPVFSHIGSGMRNGESDFRRDAFFTSGSWTYEGIYRFPEKNEVKFNYPVTQSLMRLAVTASSGDGSGRPDRHHVWMNLVLTSGSIFVDNSITLMCRPWVTGSDLAKGLNLTLTGANIFNGDPWYVSVGRFRSDDVVTSNSQSYSAPRISTSNSSSYFLRCARYSDGKISELFVTSTYLQDSPSRTASPPYRNIQETYFAAGDQSGSFIVIGSQSLKPADRMLTDPKLESRDGFGVGDKLKALSTDFNGQVSKIRFWSKGLRDKEWKSHVHDPDSIGSKDPIINYGYESQMSGTFERLRLDLQMDQPLTATDSSGHLMITNLTQEIGDARYQTALLTSSVIFKIDTFYNRLSPAFDIAQSDEKVRVRGYQSFDLIAQSDYATTSPVYEVERSEIPDDDTRFAIEFSAVKALEDDIMTLFSDLSFFDDGLGDPALMFDEVYPDLDQMRKVYFRRLTSKPQYQAFFDLYRWFNNSIGYLLEQMIPRKTKFLGIDFVYQSHPLERNRFRYLFDDSYLLAKERSVDSPGTTNVLDDYAAAEGKSW